MRTLQTRCISGMKYALNLKISATPSILIMPCILYMCRGLKRLFSAINQDKFSPILHLYIVQ